MKVIILRGISGSGKSTLAKKFAEKYANTEIFSADNYFIDPNGDYKFDAKNLSKAHGNCLRQFQSCLITGVNAASEIVDVVIIDNTNTRAVEVAPYYALAQSKGMPVGIITILCDPVLALTSNTHDVDFTTIVNQHKNLKNADFPPWWSHTYAPRIEEVGSVNEDGEVRCIDLVLLDWEKYLEEMR